MKRKHASQNPTLLEISQALGVQPDTVLEWLIQGRLVVALQGTRAFMMVDKNQTLKNRHTGEILILTKHLSKKKWQAFCC